MENKGWFVGSLSVFALPRTMDWSALPPLFIYSCRNLKPAIDTTFQTPLQT